MSRGITIGARSLGVGVALAVALQFLQPSAGFAAASINLSQYAGPPGTGVTVTGSGFQNGENVAISFQGTSLLTTTPAASPDGTIYRTITIPAGATSGNHTITATGLTSGITATAVFNVMNGGGTSLSAFKSVSINGSAYSTGGNAGAGSSLSYAIQYRNIGNAYAPSASLTDTLQMGQTFVSATAGCTTAVNLGLTTVTCSLGTIPPANVAGSVGTITIVTQVNATVGTIINNTAAITAANSMGQNSNTTTVNVGPGGGGNSGLTKSVSVSGSAYGTTVSAQPGNTLNYSIQYTNLTGVVATNVVIYDTLQPGQTLLAFPATSGSCTVFNAGTNTLSCNIGNVASGQTVGVFIATVVNNGFNGFISNQASATSSSTTIFSNTTSVQVGFTPPPPQFNGNLVLCGPVVYLGGNTITISGVTVQFFAGSFFNGTPINGANQCVTFNFNGGGATAVSVTSNLTGVGYICGTYAPTGSAASISVGGLIIPVSNNLGFQFSLQAGGYYCFLLTANGTAYSVLSSIPTSAGVIASSGGVRANRTFGY